MSDERYYETLREMQHYSAKKREKVTDEEYEEEKEKKRRGMADFREREKRGEVPEDSYRPRREVPKTGERDGPFTDPETKEKYMLKFNGRFWEREECFDPFAKKPPPEYPEILRRSYGHFWSFNDIWYSKMGILAWKKDLTEEEKEEVEKRTKEFRAETEEFLRSEWCESIERRCHEENCFYRCGSGTFIFGSYQGGDPSPIYEPITEFELGPTPKPFKDGGARLVAVQSYRPPKVCFALITNRNIFRNPYQA
jgi:hypothetical protein